MINTTQTMLDMIFNAAQNYSQNSLNFDSSNSSFDSDSTFKDMLTQKSDSTFEAKDTTTSDASAQKASDSNDTSAQTVDRDTAQKEPTQQSGTDEQSQELQLALSGANIQMIDLSAYMGTNASEISANSFGINALQTSSMQNLVQQNMQGESAQTAQDGTAQNATQTQQAVTAPEQNAEGQGAGANAQGTNTQTASTDVFTQSGNETLTQTDDTEAGGEAQTALFAKTEAMPVKVGQTVTQQATPQQTASPESALANAIVTAESNGLDSVTIKLTPENLGNLVIDIQRSPTGELSIILRPETEAAAKLLSEHSSNLGNLLSTNGNEAKVQVQQAPDTDKMWQDSNNNAGDGQSSNKQQQEKNKQDETDDFMNRLRLGLVVQDYQSA